MHWHDPMHILQNQYPNKIDVNYLNVIYYNYGQTLHTIYIQLNTDFQATKLLSLFDGVFYVELMWVWHIY